MTTLVLLPGLDGTGKLFQSFIRELPGDWRIIVAAYPADARLGYAELAALVLSTLPADGPVVLLGESFSGPVAIQLAVELGPRLEALILCCSFARNPRPALARLAPFVGVLPAPAALPSALSERVLLGADASAASRALLAQALAELPASVLHARLKAVVKVDVLRLLAQLRAPVLYLQADGDLVVPPRSAANLREVLPTLQIVRLDGPHGLLQAAPRAAAAAMLSFLARVG
ncbi:MAG: alpha/beta hydrolase [Burkholderiales bacterium]|nr:alpha/beta hydrolase [Burkholderiales bacterium]